VIAGVHIAKAEDAAPSRIDAITKSARDMMPSMPSLSLPTMPDLSMPDFSDATARLMTEFNSFTQQIGDTVTAVTRHFLRRRHPPLTEVLADRLVQCCG
jgi:hypothetical protein